MFDMRGAALGLAALLVTMSEAKAQNSQIAAQYSVYSHGLHVADANADYRLTPWGYGIKTHLTAGGLLSLFLRMDVTSSAEGRFADSSIAPIQFESGGYSRGRERHVAIQYHDGIPAVTVQDPKETDREPVSPDSLTHSFDTLSAMALLLSTLQRTGHCDGDGHIFDGLRLTEMHSQGPIPTIVPGETGEVFRGAALRCDFVGKQVAGFIKDSSHRAEMEAPRPGSAWFQNMPGLGLVAVRIEFDHPKLGHMTAVLQRLPQKT